MGLGPSDLFTTRSDHNLGHTQPRVAMNVARHKIANLLKAFFLCAPQFLLVFVYLMCSLGQFFFFQCGLERPQKLDTSEPSRSFLRIAKTEKYHPGHPSHHYEGRGTLHTEEDEVSHTGWWT